MNYEETLEYIHTVNWRGSKLGLERITELLSRMGNPQDGLRFVHVAGTNGKGSVSAMTASVLKEAGYKTGLYISPFIVRFNERMQINGEEISDKELCETVEYVKNIAEAMENLPTEFEIVCAVAMEYFKRNACDIVVLEVGLGGRLDATNVIKTPAVSVITSIDFDHMRELGNTLTEIAGEKCGIIKRGVPTVSYRQADEARAVIERVAAEKNSALVFCDFERINEKESSLKGQLFDYKDRKDLFIKLLGKHQLKNASLALDTIDVLRAAGFSIDEDAVRRGLEKTVWQGRFQLLCESPVFILDGAHNPEGIAAAVAAVREYLPERDITVLIGVLGDKDYEKMLGEVNGIAARFVASEPQSPRRLPCKELAELLRGFGKDVYEEQNVADAVKRAISLARENGGAVVSLGSLYMAGEVLSCFKGAQDEL